MIGIMKYPKLASIILSDATAYIHTAQFIKINNPEINNPIKFFLSLIVIIKDLHFEKAEVVMINITAVHKHL